MRKLVSLLALCFALSSFAQDKSAVASIVDQLWHVNADTAFVTPTLTTSKAYPTESFDVACNGTTFRFGTAAPPNPLYAGQTFIVRGVIYPGGTFSENDNNGGVNEDGTAQWPDLATGQWTCRGWVVNPSPMTLQHFDLGDDQLATDGHEVLDITVANVRGTTGGTGAYSHARGICNQWVVGVNATQAPNFVMEFVFQGNIEFKR